MAKKSAKKSPKKAAKKKAGAKKGGKKSGPKKAARKAAKKSPAKKKVAKKSAPKKKTAKKAAKKTAKKASGKSKPAARKKAAPKKAAPKAAKKAAPKSRPKAAKKAAPKRSAPRKSNVIPVVNQKAEHMSFENTGTGMNGSQVESTQEDSAEVSGKSEEEERVVAHSTSLTEGMSAPYFEGLDQFGNLVKCTGFPGKTIVLYFYPKDFTEGCTTEACSLRDEHQYLASRNFQVIGVSSDDVESHRKFAAQYHLPFPILADTEKKIIRDYDVWGRKQFAGNVFDGIVRTTFIISSNGIIRNIIGKVDNAKAAEQILSL